jgi:hypothetical protein
MLQGMAMKPLLAKPAAEGPAKIAAKSPGYRWRVLSQEAIPNRYLL